MSKTRIECDSLGAIELPADAFFGAQTQRALQNFAISGRLAHPALIRAYLNIKWAAAEANRDLQAISTRHCDLITRAIGSLLSMDPITEWPKHFPVDPYQAGAGTSQNMNINEVVANMANALVGGKLGHYEPIHPNDHVNRSQSTNDTFPAAMRLALLEVSQSLVQELELLSASLSAKGLAWRDVPKAARTHLQDAVPMRLGQEFNAYGLTVAALANDLHLARARLCVLGIGGSAAGTGLTVPEGFGKRCVAALSVLAGTELSVAPDLCEAMQSQRAVGFYASMLKLMALELTRICNDLRLLASGPLTGFAELTLPAVQPGSSIMPGKVNPSILEMCNQVWFSVLGYEHATSMALQGGQLELNVMMPIMAYSCLEASQVATKAVEALRMRCIEGLQANESRLRHYFETTPQIATALSPLLGYEQTALLVQESLQQNKTILEIVREKKLLEDTVLDQLTDPLRLMG